MAVTNWAGLKSEVANVLNRADLTDEIENFIQRAEERFNRDPRVTDADGATTKVTPLGGAQASNWLLEDHSDIYLYGALVEAAPFLREDERIAVWETELQKRLDELSGGVRNDPTRTLALTTYNGILRMAVDYVDRGDMEKVMPVMLVMAEGRLNKDKRVRNLTSAAFTISADGEAVPTGFKTLESWAHDSDTYNHPIQIVSIDSLAEMKRRHGRTGIPAYAAIVNGTFRYAPAPDGDYDTRISYWQSLTPLASGMNWLGTNHPEIYVAATLAEAFLWAGQPDAAVAWETKLDMYLEGLYDDTWDDQWGGGTLRKHYPVIGI